MLHCIIIGAGLSGLSLAWYLKRFSKNAFKITILESENRAGGKAWTDRRDGFLIEKGVNGVLDNKPSTIELAKELGLSLLKSNDASRIRFVVRDKRLVRLPDSPGSFLKSEVLSLSGKLRLFCEPFIKKAPEGLDESLASFAKRRLGEEAYNYLIDPMASGIYAGNPERLSLKACFPRIYELEQKYGSLIKAMISLQREAKKKGERKKASAGPGGVLTSFNSGMEELVEALCDKLKEELFLNQRVESIYRENGLWKVVVNGSKVYEGSHIVLALPAYRARYIVKDLSKELCRLFSFFEYPPIAVCAFSFKREKVSNLNGFGFLCPNIEKRAILGSLWDSSVFQHRAPEGYHLLRCLMGGMRNRHILEKSDHQLKELALAELKELIGIKADPELAICYRWERAIPQYHIGYDKVISQIKKELLKHSRLYIRCNWIGGVSLNDCVLNSKRLAQAISKEQDLIRL